MAAAEFSCTAQDVVEALGRLSAVAGGQPLDVEGAPVAQPHELQSLWQAVADVAGNGDVELSEAAVAQLRAVMQGIEAVIISCGSPDSFDVYEVCFETLAKIGFFLKTLAAKELLVRAMEDVHEVYDVLLSCVETYEWVQPGATGNLRLWMLQLLFACVGAKNITGRDLMELMDNDVQGAVSLISFIIRCGQAPFEMQSVAGQCLVQLTTADAVFMQKAEGGGLDGQTEQIAKLTKMLNNHVNGLIQGIIQFDIVHAFGMCICQHQMSHARTDIIVKHFLTTIHNCLLYCSGYQKKLRQHLATSSIVQEIMIPYVHNILPALSENPACGPHMIEWQNLKSALQCLVVVTFNIDVFRGQLRNADMLLKVCEVPQILTHASTIELLIKIAINVDFTKGPYSDVLLTTFENAFNSLPEESRMRLQRRLTSEQSMRLPFAKSSVDAVRALSFVLTPPPGEEGTSAAAVATRKARRKQRWRKAKNKNKKRKKLFAMQHHWKVAKEEEGEPEDEADDEEESDDDDMPPLIPCDGWEGYLGASDEAGVPTGAVCQLSGALMHDPVQTPEGQLFERAALEDWVRTFASNPVTGTPLNMLECQEAVELMSYIQGYQMQMFAACMIAPEAFDEPPQPPCEVPEPAAPAPPAAAAPAQPLATGPSLLGDLPALQKAVPEKKKKEKTKIHIESRSVVECPEDMRCAIDGKVMLNPVLSPFGHHFEQKTLEKWITNCGSVCPITNQPLRLEDCTADPEMKKRIVKFLKGGQ